MGNKFEELCNQHDLFALKDLNANMAKQSLNQLLAARARSQQPGISHVPMLYGDTGQPKGEALLFERQGRNAAEGLQELEKIQEELQKHGIISTMCPDGAQGQQITGLRVKTKQSKRVQDMVEGSTQSLNQVLYAASEADLNKQFLVEGKPVLIFRESMNPNAPSLDVIRMKLESEGIDVVMEDKQSRAGAGLRVRTENMGMVDKMILDAIEEQEKAAMQQRPSNGWKRG